MIRRLSVLAAAGAVSLAFLATGAHAATAPRVRIGSLAELPTPLPYPYDVDADAERALSAALKRAKATHRKVLVDLGGNWCADCRILAAVMDLPEVAAFVKAHYEVVMVDVGRLDRNTQIAERYGLKLEGVPSILILDDQGRLLDRGHEPALADARSMTPQALADWLARWTN
jgi:thiol-disulfide isomerase/thioredoxin